MKMAIHQYNVADEIGIEVSRPIWVAVDAAAALGYINSTGTATRMKHLDLRDQWIQQMRTKDIVDYFKVEGVNNLADFFTKIHHGADFKTFQDRLMDSLDDE